jgi:hypothetical protein
MKNTAKILAVAVTASLVFSSCAKQPGDQIDAAKAAIQAVVSAKGDVYAKDELKKINDDMQSAMVEIAAQSKKFFKKYGGSKEALAKIIADADAVKALIPVRIEEAKAAAETAMNEAKTGWDEAKALLEKAPRGKGTQADIAAMKSDLAGLESALGEAMTRFDAEDYLGAKERAEAVKEKAVEISDQIKAAIAKVRR